MRSGIRATVLVVACASGTWAQAMAGAGMVSGFILEGPDDGLPDATVTVSNSALGVRRVAITTDDGAFDVPGLPPGVDYRMKVERNGFAGWESAAFEVAVGQTRVIHITF